MIKTGSIDHFNDLLPLGNRWADEFEIENYVEDAWLEMTRHYIIHVDQAVLVFCDNLNRVKGFVFGVVHRIPHSTEMVAQIHYIYLTPEHCTHDNLYELHQGFVDWARTFNVVDITAPDFYRLPDQYIKFFDEVGYQQEYTILHKGLA